MQKDDFDENTLCMPAIPEKQYFTIGEMSRLCKIKPNILRYWESEFTELKNIKRRGNRRYYTYKQLLLVRKIRHLLCDQKSNLAIIRESIHQSLYSQKPKKYSLHKEIEELEEIVKLLQS